MKIIKLSVLVAAIFSSFSIQAQDPSQSVFVNGTPKGMLGSPVSITVGYDVTDADATLTGLGLRVHYNSSALEFVEFANVLTTDNISSDGSSDDVDDLDGDASTDKFITANWASLFGSWPGSLPSDLLTATFNVADDDSLESTVINFSAASNAAGYLFAPSSYTLDIIGGSWDFDGNGTVDALTDGLLMLRHSFNLRGDGLIDGAVATDSTLTHEQVEANLTAAYQIADIDDNGAVDALTDGLMLLRYMFNLRGEALVDQTVAQDAVRTTHADIEQYIASFMPSDDDTGSGDTGSGDTGSGDTGSGGDDFVTETVGPANFIEAFGGTTIQGDEFTHPSSAEPWAGIANMDLSLYPLSFADGGSISFTGAVPSGGSVNVQFKFEFNSHPDTEPSYSTAFTTISGSADQAYTIQIPSQGIKTFSNLIFYIQERNTAVKIADLMITTSTDPNGGSGSGGNGIDAPDDYNTLGYGAGSIGDAIYPSNHRCKSDYGYWVENAGVISTNAAVQALGCNQGTGIPTGNITKLYPQLTGPAASKPTQTHKWWGSISFLGEMTVGDYDDSAYITPDPISARINNKGARVGGIPSGLRVTNPGQYYYPIGDHAAEVFDGIAVGNSAYSNLEAFTKDHSEGSVTVLWKSGSTDVMEATFVHGSPYVYFKAYAGNLEVRTLRQDGVGEKGTFSTPSNMLGIWTNVAGAINNFLIVGEGSTSFPDLSDNADPMTMGTNGVINSAKEMTLVYLPHLTAGSVSSSMINQFASAARNKVAAVNIDYAVDSSNNEVTVTHSYVDEQGAAVDTIAGMHPLHWKNASQATTPYQIRSARGTIKFAELSQFSYQIPYVGVLPTLPSIDGSFNQATLAGLVTDFVNQGSNVWNTSAEGDLYEDTYWSGKNYGKVAEVSAIARSIGMTTEANDMIDWLKAELSDWFSSEADGVLKTKKYFVYDSDWNTLLGFDEAYGSHQRLADHHFHYGYFVRAAAEICRVDLAWCGQDQYGPMIELLIRDYAADKDDPMFPHMRNFDPANGFSWADGKMNFIRGNNNESTSEAATAYGAIILYGLATGNTELTEKGMYLHASTGATYWEYWNNIDGYNNVSAESNNFFPGYAHITTSIIWGDGVDFATWFSGAYAHILGIQGLPSSPLIFHVGLHADYMEDYVDLGLSESSNNKPSGLVDDQWRDLWWNLWAMTDAQAAIADYNSVSSYVPEQGESKAHTYHWIHTFDELGHLATGTGDITANHPAAIAFDKNGTKSYVVYNFTDQTIPVTFKQGNTVIHTMNATPFGFTVE